MSSFLFKAFSMQSRRNFSHFFLCFIFLNGLMVCHWWKQLILNGFHWPQIEISSGLISILKTAKNCMNWGNNETGGSVLYTFPLACALWNKAFFLKQICWANYILTHAALDCSYFWRFQWNRKHTVPYHGEGELLDFFVGLQGRIAALCHQYFMFVVSRGRF